MSIEAGFSIMPSCLKITCDLKRHFIKWFWITIVSIVAFVLMFAGCSRKNPSDNYNVLLVTLDTTRTERLSCYGYDKITSPNIDMLAKEGIRFDMSISTSAATPISHASILTGLNPFEHGVRVLYAANGCKLPKTIPTMATILHNECWETAAFLSAFPVSEFYQFDRGFDIFDNGMTGDVYNKMKQSDNGDWKWGIRQNQRPSNETSEAAIHWLKKKRKQNKAFFMWVHYWDPHDPIKLPPKEILSHFPPDNISQAAKTSSIYDAEIFYMDSQLGRLLDTIKDIGEYQNTIIVIIADHGQGLDDGLERHGWYGHRLLYQEQIRVPMIIKIPKGPKDKVIPQLVRNIDIFPTIMDILNIHIPQPVAGRSLIDLINGLPNKNRVAYADALNLYDLNAGIINKKRKEGLLYCAMDRSWKLIFHYSNPENSELYNIETDPLETNNLYNQHNPEYRRLFKCLQVFDGFVDKPFGDATEDSSAFEALKSLGYAE